MWGILEMATCTKNTSDKCKAICQMNVLNVLFLGGGMDLGQAIAELGLANPKYARLADAEGFDMVAFNIRKALNT